MGKSIRHNKSIVIIQGFPGLFLQPWSSPTPAMTPSRLVTSGGHDWRPVETCSFKDIFELGSFHSTEILLFCFFAYECQLNSVLF